jgi:hypothetical protein
MHQPIDLTARFAGINLPETHQQMIVSPTKKGVTL